MPFQEESKKLSSHIRSLRITTMGRFLYTFLPYRRYVVMHNMNQVYGEQLDQQEKILLAKAFYSHVATSIKEALLMRFMNEATLKASVEVRGYQYLLDMATNKRGILILTGHFGNWEFAPIGGILHFKQFQGQFHFIRRTLVNKWIERIVFKRYYQVGLNVIPQKNSLQYVCDVLDKNHVVVFVLDQHASLKNRDGIAVEFFGKPAGTYRSLASISRYTGLPVIPASSYRLSNGKHVLEFHAPMPWEDRPSTHEALYHNTLHYNHMLERLLLLHPEQWNWFHKRWKLKSP